MVHTIGQNRHGMVYRLNFILIIFCAVDILHQFVFLTNLHTSTSSQENKISFVPILHKKKKNNLIFMHIPKNAGFSIEESGRDGVESIKHNRGF